MFELVKVPYSYKDKNGKERIGYNFFLVTSSGERVQISPHYNEYNGKTHTTRDSLILLATKVEK